MRRILLVVLALSVLVARPLHAAPGDLDPSFGAGTGKVRFGAAGGSATPGAIAVQSDGRPVSVALGIDGTTKTLLVLRHNLDGSPDTTFGLHGRVALPLTAWDDARITAVQLQSDGKVVVAGSVYDGYNWSALLVRLSTAGVPDSTFHYDGFAQANLPSRDLTLAALAVQADGRLVAGCTAGAVFGGAGADFAAARFNTDGTLDTGFGTTGVVVVDMLSPNDFTTAMTIQSDGKIVLAGHVTTTGASSQWGLARLTTTGALDATFGGTGRVFAQTTGTNDWPTAIAFQSNALASGYRLIVAGAPWYSSAPGSAVVLMRYKLDGTLDAAFGTAGRSVTLVNGHDCYVSSVAVQLGKNNAVNYYVGGSLDTLDFSTYTRLLVMRFTATGATDITFGSAGLLASQLGAGSATGVGLGIATSGLYQVAAFFTATDRHVAIARTTTLGALDPAFDLDGVRLESFGATTFDVRATALQADGRIVLAGSYSGSPVPFGLARLLPDGSPDPGFAAGAPQTAAATHANAEAVLVQPDGRILVTGNDTSYGYVARYLTTGVPDTTFGLHGVYAYVGNGTKPSLRALALQADGSILVAGNARFPDPTLGFHYNGLVFRLTPVGQMDPSFGHLGEVDNLALDLATSIVVDRRGRPVIGGSYYAQFSIQRLTTQGAGDAAFGTFGYRTDSLGTASIVNALALQPDGRIVAAGTATQGFGDNFFVARLDSTGQMDASFGTNGVAIRDLVFGADQANAVAVETDGRILAAGRITNLVVDRGFFRTSGAVAVAGFLANGAIDAGFGSNGAVFSTFGNGTDDTVWGLAMDSHGRAVVAGTSSGYAAVERLLGSVALAVPPGAGTAHELALSAPWPNPAHGSVRLDFELPASAHVTVEVYDVSGRRTARLADTAFTAGVHALRWNGTGANGLKLPGGVYFVTLRALGQSRTQRMVLLGR